MYLQIYGLDYLKAINISTFLGLVDPSISSPEKEKKNLLVSISYLVNWINQNSSALPCKELQICFKLLKIYGGDSGDIFYHLSTH